MSATETKDKLLLPDNCFYAQPPYDYANVLDEGPNTSTAPVQDTIPSAAFRGLVYALAIISTAVLIAAELVHLFWGAK